MVKNIISYKNIVRVAFPIIVSGLSINIVTITDTIFLSNLSEVALGAAGNAAILFYIFILLGAGFTVGAQIIIARRNGEENFSKIGSLVSQSAYFILFLGLLFFVFLRYFTPTLLSNIVQSKDVFSLIVEYLQQRSWGIFFSLITLVYVAFYVGTTKTKVLGFITPITALLNIFLDYAFIFGHFGFEPMGVKGAALASNLAEFLGVTLFTIYTLQLKSKKKYNLFVIEWPNLQKIGKILYTAGPIMIQNFLTLGAWFVFFTLIENIGQNELAVSHIIRSIYMIIMIPVFGFADSTNTLTSNLMGQGKPNLVFSLIFRICIISFVSLLVMMPLVNWQSHLVIGLYTQNPIIYKMTAEVLKVISMAIFVFALGIILYRAIAGTGKTIVAFWIEVVTLVIYLAYVVYVTRIVPSSLNVIWASEFVYFGFMSVIGILYLKNGQWKRSNI